MLQVVEYLQTLPVWADLRDMAVAVHFVEHSEGRWCVWPIFDGLSPIKRTKTIHFFKHDWLNQNVKMPRTQNDVDSLKLILLKGLLLSFSCRKLIAKIPTRWWERPWVQLQAGWPEPWSHVKTTLPRCLPSCSRSRLWIFEARRVALGPEKFKALEVGRVTIRREGELNWLSWCGEGDYEICLLYLMMRLMPLNTWKNSTVFLKTY